VTALFVTLSILCMPLFVLCGLHCDHRDHYSENYDGDDFDDYCCHCECCCTCLGCEYGPREFFAAAEDPS
jgi:hypothetical protein